MTNGTPAAKTYTLDGPIVLEALSAQQALTFAGAVINAVPSYSMGTASLHIKCIGPNGTSSDVSGDSVEALKASLAEASGKTGKDPADIRYDVRGKVNLVGLSFEDGMQVIDAAMRAIPPHSLVVTGMIAQME